MKKVIVGLLIVFLVLVPIGVIVQTTLRNSVDKDSPTIFLKRNKTKLLLVGAAVELLPKDKDLFAKTVKRPAPVPEPMSYVLIATGGAALAGVRYWMAKRRCKKDLEASRDSDI
ncbi:MAG: hypothetical protein HW406_132 [Candidatus Brocadiaceae bacterium]|nr:hypothetical protein [Candidatus Brocadiaceae bacterium]